MPRTPLTAIVLSRLPEPGRIKTRLSGPGGFSAATAAAIAEAMLQCTLARLAARGPAVLAVTPDGCGPGLLSRLGIGGVEVADQGTGDLGARLDRLWSAAGAAGPVAFFGIDSPDVPDEALDRIGEAVRGPAVAVGPTLDGGYWTLAAGRPVPAVLRHIDWGSRSVYDQTVARADSAGLAVHKLPAWPDVDEPRDVAALRRRLSNCPPGAGPLQRLGERLESLCGNG